MKHCIYCGYMLGSTKEHIIPRALLSDLRLHTHRNIEPPEHNIAPCCEICNCTKASRVILPTPGHLTDIYVNTPALYLRGLAEWITFNKNDLRDFFEKEGNRQFYGVELYEIDTVVTLYWKDYYEKLNDQTRNIPNNAFNRQDLIKQK